MAFGVYVCHQPVQVHRQVIEFGDGSECFSGPEEVQATEQAWGGCDSGEKQGPAGEFACVRREKGGRGALGPDQCREAISDGLSHELLGAGAVRA